MSLYNLPPYKWTPDDDSLFELMPNRGIVSFLLESKGVTVTTEQVKYRRQALKTAREASQARERLGLPPLERRPQQQEFDAANEHLLGTMPDLILSQKLGVSHHSVRLARTRIGIASYKETRKCSYDEQLEEDMLRTVREISFFLPENTFEKACKILHKVHPDWIAQCLAQIKRESEAA